MCDINVGILPCGCKYNDAPSANDCKIKYSKKTISWTEPNGNSYVSFVNSDDNIKIIKDLQNEILMLKTIIAKLVQL